MTADHAETERSTRIARVLISAFQEAVLPKNASYNDVFLLPTFLPITCDDLSAQLASLPKPIACVGFSNSAALVIGYWVVPPEVNDSFDRRYPRMLRRGREALARQWRIKDVNRQVAIVLGSGSASLAWQDYWTLREDYVTPYLSWLEERAGWSLARRGYICSVRVRPSGGMTITLKDTNAERR